MSTTATTSVADCGPRHRACDECRTRKLACTKEPEGCSRCKREGITCHYSPQKPMGRPRKRPRDETNTENSVAAPASKNTMTEIPADTADPGLAFLNILASGDIDYMNYDNMGSGNNNNNNNDLENALAIQPQDKGYQFSFGYTGDSLGDIGFDPLPQHNPSFSNSNIDPSLFVLEPPPADHVPTLSPDTVGTPESIGSNSGSGVCNHSSTTNTGAVTQPTQTCAHTAALYLALEAMQKVPSGVEEALRHARRATRTAYDVVYCPVCSFQIEPAESGSAGEVTRNFQNLMLLAALIPSIVHAYQRILVAVDEETCRATAERRRLVFKLHGFGGILWADASAEECVRAATLEHREMEPAMWRLTVRALLKVDVYGLSECRVDMDTEAMPLHIGLKDIVLQMEQKSRARHAVMDALMRKGAWEPPKCGFRMHEPGETPTCLRVIAIAKASIDSLIIA
ncbi:hypothetical protein F5B19DRAFT_405815 [Rostrohypoxylon terebratum]|nr:hypothetical protein F5B19DRAFT_405815 [Rostrohypoxylon terebratum]